MILPSFVYRLLFACWRIVVSNSLAVFRLMFSAFNLPASNPTFFHPPFLPGLMPLVCLLDFIIGSKESFLKLFFGQGDRKPEFV